MTELEELQARVRERSDHYFMIEDLAEDWDLIEDGNWEQEGKYQIHRTIVSKNGKFFAIDQGRSGSYHTDWYYDEAEVSEVTRKEITTVEWVV